MGRTAAPPPLAAAAALAMARGKKRAAPAQKTLEVSRFKLIDKPLALLGKQIKVPGKWWSGRMSTAELETEYVCTILDFSLAHRCEPSREIFRAHNR